MVAEEPLDARDGRGGVRLGLQVAVPPQEDDVLRAERALREGLEGREERGVVDVAEEEAVVVGVGAPTTRVGNDFSSVFAVKISRKSSPPQDAGARSKARISIWRFTRRIASESVRSSSSHDSRSSENPARSWAALIVAVGTLRAMTWPYGARTI